MRKIHIYILGVMLLGAAQDFIRSAVRRDAASFLIVVTYLVILRLIAEKFGKP
jgi:hypothetical protein